MVDSLFVPLPRRIELAVILPHPVPPTFTASVDEADQTPERIVATPVSAEESIPVPPFAADTVPVSVPSDRQVVPIAKHPLVMETPTLDVEVAEPEMFNPERVVVPKPSDETESCVAVDEPTTKPIESPATGLTARRAEGVVVPTPMRPPFVTMR